MSQDSNQGAPRQWTGAIKIISAVGNAILIAMALMTVADVILRYLFKMPWPGTFEVTGFMMAVCVFLWLPFGTAQGSHIAIDLVIQKVSGRKRAIIDACNSFLGFVFLALLAWRLPLESIHLAKTGQYGPMTHFPVAIVAYVASFGAILGCLAAGILFILTLKEVVRK